jgi:hypothetical protein
VGKFSTFVVLLMILVIKLQGDFIFASVFCILCGSDLLNRLVLILHLLKFMDHNEF